MAQVRWRDLPESDDTLEPVARVCEDALQLFKKLHAGKNAPSHLVKNARRELRF